ncbi:MAG: helix-turn-helix domain-containing protein [Candidatus Sulfotelmatobacter sp.]
MPYDVGTVLPHRMGPFGDKFRKAREAKELSLDDVSNVTKISPRMLQAIEDENFDRLPGGVFNKGFIRAYAKHLSLSPEDAITEYLECLRQAQVAAQQAWEPAAQTEASPPAPAPVSKKVTPATITPVAVSAGKSAPKGQPAVEVEELPELQVPRQADIRPRARTTFTPSAKSGSSWRLILVAALIFVLGVVLWTRRSGSTSQPTAAANPAPTNATSSSSVPARPVVVPPQSLPTSSSTPVPAANSAALLQSQLTNSHSSKSNPPAATAPASAAMPDGPSVEEKNDVTIRTFGKPAPPTAADTTASFTLIIRATENSWLSIVADGQPVRQETLIAPAHTSIHATREVVVKVGNAAGVSFLLNGKEISPQGNEAEPKTLVFDSSGLKTAP